jgi:hypothetical protein
MISSSKGESYRARLELKLDASAELGRGSAATPFVAAATSRSTSRQPPSSSDRLARSALGRAAGAQPWPRRSKTARARLPTNRRTRNETGARTPPRATGSPSPRRATRRIPFPGSIRCRCAGARRAGARLEDSQKSLRRPHRPLSRRTSRLPSASETAL